MTAVWFRYDGCEMDSPVGADLCVRPSVRYRTDTEASDRRRSACLYKTPQIVMNP